MCEQIISKGKCIMDELIRLEERVEKIRNNFDDFLKKSLIDAECDVSLSMNIVVTCSEEDLTPILNYCGDNPSVCFHDLKQIDGKRRRIFISIK